MTQNNLTKLLETFRDSHPCVKNFSLEEYLLHVALFAEDKNLSGLPKDFSISGYKNLYSDLQNLTDKQIISHFLTTGKEQQRMYGLPDDFDVATYKELNPDIKDYTDFQAKQHYMKFGKNEYRSYFLDLPEDFCCEGYRKYNPDLANQTDLWVKQHYTVQGKHESRLYKIHTPEDFLPEHYVFFNRDLKNLTEEQLKVHYYEHGCLEERKYKDELFDEEFFIRYNNIANYEGYQTYTKDITQIKSQYVLNYVENLTKEKQQDCILLVNHLATLQGATHYLYNLYKIVKDLTDQPVYIVDAEFNELLATKYKIPYDQIISYERDSTLLYYVCTKLNPCKIYFNSINSQMVDVYKALGGKNIILHSHEIKEHFTKFTSSIIPDYVVSDKIKQTYNTDESVKPFVSQELLPQTCLNEIEEQLTLPTNLNFLNPNAITIGMCGTTSKRKNFNLFLELSKQFPEYNFLWIGGNKRKTDYPKNFIHIEQTITPYTFYKEIDYFLLTSEIDPSPYVVLENLYVGNKVITFKNNIFVNHKCDILKGIYFVYPKPVNLANAGAALQRFVSKEKPAKNNIGKEYIKENFSKFNKNLLIELLLPADFNSKRFLEFNSDLVGYSADEAKWAFIYKNLLRSRQYKVEGLPANFSCEQYKFFNNDLSTLNDAELEQHYVEYGQHENRKYIDEFFDLNYCLTYPSENKIRSFIESTTKLDLPKNNLQEKLLSLIPVKTYDIALVDSTEQITDSSQYLHFLYRYIKQNTNKSVCILSPFINEEKIYKYNIEKEHVYEYKNDSTLLYNFCRKISNKIIFVSMNFTMSHVAKHFQDNNISFWAQETLEEYQSDRYHYKVIPNVTTIKKDSETHNINYAPKLFDEEFFAIAKLQSKETSWTDKWIGVKNRCGWIDPSKIIIGTSGEINEKKYIEVFIQCAKNLPNLNFMWIGGKIDSRFKKISNIYHVKQKQWPFAYYAKMDYFLCLDALAKSYSIMENLYLGTPIIAFKENIDTSYKNKSFEKNVCLLKGNIENKNLINFLSSLPPTKPKKCPELGLKFIKKYTAAMEEYEKI